jgi:NAD(P)H dehydrogenase (quinone)
MKHLIIYAHPNTNSFNHAIKIKLSETLLRAGHEVKVRDLNALGFNPVLSATDLQNIHAGASPLDITTEQEFINWADIISFVYPIWWTGLPAILKGYIDRVFHYGFAYAIDKNGIVKLLGAKKALMFSTHGMPKQVYEGEMYKAMNLTQDVGIMNFCGIEVLHHEYFPSASTPDAKLHNEYLKRIEQILSEVEISEMSKLN